MELSIEQICKKIDNSIEVIKKDGVFILTDDDDRAKTIKALINPKTKPDNLGRLGHVFPLASHKGGGMKERSGHTEASLVLTELAGFKAGGVLIEVMNTDGTMARYNDLIKNSENHDLPLITIEEMLMYLKHSPKL